MQLSVRSALAITISEIGEVVILKSWIGAAVCNTAVCIYGLITYGTLFGGGGTLCIINNIKMRIVDTVMAYSTMVFCLNGTTLHFYTMERGYRKLYFTEKLMEQVRIIPK